MGPDLSHRRTLMTEVLRGRAVRALVAQEAVDRRVSRRQALLDAKAMFDEIAADYSHIFVALMSRVFRRLWTRIYDGVVVAHADTIAAVAAGNELVYVPCHRSTMDDVLMPYAIYSHGYAVPHIAAGINLNLPLVGPMLRKCGAFFMRRSFRGSACISAVFTRYLGAIMARGHPIPVLHRRRAQPYRSFADAQDRHAVDDLAQLSAPARASHRVRAGLYRLRAHHGSGQLRG